MIQLLLIIEHKPDEGCNIITYVTIDEDFDTYFIMNVM